MSKIENIKSGIEGFISYPEKKQGSGILILHAWWGLNDFIQDLSQKLSKKGYVVFAPDLYQGKIAKSIEEAEKLVNSMDEDETKRILTESVDYLIKRTNRSIRIIGFSMGAGWATWLANKKPESVEKVVLFYGTGETDFSNTRASFLCHFAENDPYEEPKYVDQFKEALMKANIQATHYHYPGTHHWFFEANQGDYYQKQASELAWKRTLKFFNE